MKKAVSIFAVLLMTIGLFSCEAEPTAEDQALYEVNASDNQNDSSGRN